MKSRVLVSGVLALVAALPLYGCGGGGGGSAPGNSGITVQLLSIQANTDLVASAAPNTNDLATFALQVALQNGITTFPNNAKVDSCTITYTPNTVANDTTYTIPPYTIPAPNCAFTAVGSVNCSREMLLLGTSKTAWWNAFGADIATIDNQYTANYTCNYSSANGGGGTFSGGFTFFLGVDPAAAMTVTPPAPADAPVVISALDPSKSFALTNGIGSYIIAYEADPTDLITVSVIDPLTHSFTVNRNAIAGTGTASVLIQDSANPPHSVTVNIQVN